MIIDFIHYSFVGVRWIRGNLGWVGKSLGLGSGFGKAALYWIVGDRGEGYRSPGSWDFFCLVGSVGRGNTYFSEVSAMV